MSKGTGFPRRSEPRMRRTRRERLKVAAVSVFRVIFLALIVVGGLALWLRSERLALADVPGFLVERLGGWIIGVVASVAIITPLWLLGLLGRNMRVWLVMRHRMQDAGRLEGFMADNEQLTAARKAHGVARLRGAFSLLGMLASCGVVLWLAPPRFAALALLPLLTTPAGFFGRSVVFDADSAADALSESLF